MHRTAASVVIVSALVAGAFAPLGADVPPPDEDPRYLGFPGADWAAILTRKDPTDLPTPLEKVEWRRDFWKSLREAQTTGRPLFVTFRCEPCKQCADFDKEVLEGGPTLDPLLRQFITVRITNAEALDRRLFPWPGFQDLDLSWWGYFLGSDGSLYGVFGGRDHVSAATRISVGALANTLRRVLEWHYHPERKSWKVDRPVPDLRGKRDIAFDLPGWESWKKRYLPKGQGCLHCHQVIEIDRQDEIDARKFDKHRELDMWPLPENVGIVLDRDHGLRIAKIEPESAAARAGLEPGDVLGSAGGHPLFSQTDFRGVLHRGPRDEGTFDLWWLRDGKPMRGTLAVEKGWRATILDWRMSVSQGNIGAGPGFFPIEGSERGGTKLAKPYFGPKPSSPAWDAGVRPHHVILAVNGETPPGPGRQFLVWFRLRHEPGEEIELKVDDKGTEKVFRYKLIRKAE